MTELCKWIRDTLKFYFASHETSHIYEIKIKYVLLRVYVCA